MSHSDPLALLTDQISGIPGTPPDTYFCEAECRDIYPAVLDILAPLGKTAANVVVREMDQAFSAITDATMRYRNIYVCLRVASLMVDGLTPPPSMDILDAPYAAAVPQGQTQTALYAITEEVLQKVGLAPSSKDIQSDRYLVLRSKPIAKPGQNVIEFDELVRHCQSITTTNSLLSMNMSGVPVGRRALIAQHINPKKDLNETQALPFHVDVARVLGINIRPHSTASCYSEPINISRDDFVKLTQALHLRPSGTWSDTVTWDVTDPSTYAGTGIRRLTSFFSGERLDELSGLLGCHHWSDMLTDVRVDWQVLLRDINHVTIRFSPQVQLNPVRMESVKHWFKPFADPPGTWTVDHTLAALDYARMLASSLVFKMWADLDPLKQFALRPDTRALQLIVGNELATHLTKPVPQAFSLLETGSGPFEPSDQSPTPELDTRGSTTRNCRYILATSAKVSNRVYDPVNRASNSDDHPVHFGQRVRWVDTLSILQEAWSVDSRHLRADIGLTQALAGPTWLRNEWIAWQDGLAYPGSRCAEVSPRLKAFPPGLQLASTPSYDRLTF